MLKVSMLFGTVSPDLSAGFLNLAYDLDSMASPAQSWIMPTLNMAEGWRLCRYSDASDRSRTDSRTAVIAFYVSAAHLSGQHIPV